MQESVRRLVEGRTQMLAAISHDLRTPLTLLRLRAEEAENTDEREKALATIGEMDGMISSMLAFARDEMFAEPRRRVDLTTLVESVVDDMTDAGIDVRMEPSEPLPFECQPAAIKRVVANLLDNAIKYGKRADVTIVRLPDSVEIVVEDQGPGILPMKSRKSFSRSTVSRILATARPAARAWVLRFRNPSLRRTAAKSRSQTERAAAYVQPFACPDEMSLQR